MKIYQQKSTISVFTGLALLLSGIVLTLIFARHQLAIQFEKDARTFIDQFDEVVYERIKVLKQLNELNFKQCDENTMLAMRQALFDAKYIVDIGFVNDNTLLCSTGVGNLEQGITLVKPDFILKNNVKIKYESGMKLLLLPDREIEAVVVTQGNYNLIMSVNNFHYNKQRAFRWQLFYRQGLVLQNLAGEQHLYKKIASKQFYSYETTVFCSEKQPYYCIAIYLPWKQFFIEHQKYFFISLLFTLFVSMSISLILFSLLSDRRTTLYRVRKGLANHSFYWAYQPIINMQTGEMIGCEVLARFQDKFGTMYPDKFIPIIRKSLLTWEFTQAMIDTAFKELGDSSLNEGFKVSINIFPCDVEKGLVTQLIDNKRLTSSRFLINLEITEDEYLDTTVAHTHFKALAQAGFQLSLDDFGTGYSNLRNLQHLSFHQLKIDRTFVQDIATEGLKASMIPNIMALVSKLNFSCVAEGIETPEQEALLKQVGVHFGQGYKYGKPMNIEDFNDFINKQ
jgi:sensor c-di-GMP phosphodiesterase-like protein